MNNEAPDELQSLWQQQPVFKPDVTQLKKTWWHMRLKQYAYVVLDALAVITLPVFLYFSDKKISPFELAWFASVYALLSVFFIYLVWLRRYSLGFGPSSDTTTDFSNKICLQYRQNIRIAQVNKHLCYYMPLIFIAYCAFGYFGEHIDQETVIRKGKLMLLVNMVSLPIIWFWAYKRQQRFTRLLTDFEKNWQT